MQKKANSTNSSSQENKKIKPQLSSSLEQQVEAQSKSYQDQLIEEDNKFKQKKNNFNTLSWTLQDEKNLIQLHRKIGNRWTLLSRHFPGSCENFIKNHFYSRLRKSVRKLNKNIANIFPKKYNKFNLNIIFKLSNISQGKVIGKCNIENQISSYYKDFIYRLIQFSENQEAIAQENSKEQFAASVQSLILSLIALQNLFRIISGERIYKGKKKNIAYLKRFNFKLDCLTSKTLVISKEKCFISDEPFEVQSQVQKSSQYLIHPQIMEDEEQKEKSTYKISSLRFLQNTAKPSNQTIQESPRYKPMEPQTIEHTDDSHIQSSLSSFTLMDDELRQFQMPILCQKPSNTENLLDKYGGNKFQYFEM